MPYPRFLAKENRASFEEASAGLCGDCFHGKRIESARGSVFYLCGRSAIDPAFPKYPHLPVVQCCGYMPKTEMVPPVRISPDGTA